MQKSNIEVKKLIPDFKERNRKTKSNPVLLLSECTILKYIFNQNDSSILKKIMHKNFCILFFYNLF